MSAPAGCAAAGAPRTTFTLFGHARALALWRTALAKGRVPHAWLIEGPAGIGKATLAYRMARDYLAPDAGAAADPEAPSNRQISAGAHAELLIIAREANKAGKLRAEITVEQIRTAREKMQQGAMAGTRRVLIIDEAERMNTNAANALLKLLEEPQPGRLLLLVSQRRGGVLATIRSRCAFLPLSPLDEVTGAQVVAQLLPDVPPERRAALNRLCAGRPGEALRAEANDWLGAYAAWLSGLLDEAEALNSAARLAKLIAADGYGAALSLLHSAIARSLRVHAGAELVPIIPDEVVRLKRLAERFGPVALAERGAAAATLANQAQTRYLDAQAVVLRLLAGPERVPSAA